MRKKGAQDGEEVRVEREELRKRGSQNGKEEKVKLELRKRGAKD